MADSRARCSCGRLARYYGQFAGGVCVAHAIAMIEMFTDGIDQFWPEHRDALRTIMQNRDTHGR